MQYAIIFKVLGILLMVFSLNQAIPVFISFWYQDGEHSSFLFSMIITFTSGLAAWLPSYGVKRDLRTRDGFLITTLFWVVLALFGALPLMLASSTQLSFTNASFESLSAITTTGATVMSGLDLLPKSILFYRQQLQWFGGIGIVVIAVAVMPMLGIGGMQFYRAETPGAAKENKLTPRITETAKILLFIYIGLTVACCISYWLAGMTLFDAVGHAFSTVSIGGFSTHDDSLGYFKNHWVLVISIVFMFLSAANFVLHFTGWRTKSIAHYREDPEFRFYATVVLIGIILVSIYLGTTGIYDWPTSLLYGTFEVVSVLTTTGFSLADSSIWSTFVPQFIFMLAFMGGCAGSTAGGIKMIRILLMLKQGLRELDSLIHPNAQIPIKIGRRTVPDRVLEAVWGFVAIYVVVFVIMLLLLLVTGLDFVSAFSAVAACINNLGPGLGEVEHNYTNIAPIAKWVLCVAMLLGRLEIFTLIVLFTPMFWRR